MAETQNFTSFAEYEAADPFYLNGASFWPDISGIPTTPTAPEGGFPASPDDSGIPTTPTAPEGGFPAAPDNSGIPTTPIAPPDGFPVPPDISGIPTTPNLLPGGPPVPPGLPGIPTTPNLLPGGPPLPPYLPGIPTTPIAPPGGPPLPPYLPGIPTTPIAPPGRPPVDQGIYWPVYPLPTPGLPTIPSIPSYPYYGQVRFLNATTDRESLDVYIDSQRVLSGSTFATVSIYISVTDGFHTVTVRQTNGRILYQQSHAFVSGEKMTMVILDAPGGVTLARVSDMGCTNIPSGYGCCRVANMSYSGSNYDVRLGNNQIVFAGVGFKEVTSYKQASAGNYTFFITNSRVNFTTVRELPVIILSALVGPGCMNCGVSNPLLTYSLNIRAGRSYTSYIIGNPWSNLYQVHTLED